MNNQVWTFKEDDPALELGQYLAGLVDAAKDLKTREDKLRDAAERALDHATSGLEYGATTSACELVVLALEEGLEA